MKLIKVKCDGSYKKIEKDGYSYYLYEGRFGISLSRIFKDNVELPRKYQTDPNRVFPLENSAKKYANELIEQYEKHLARKRK